MINEICAEIKNYFTFEFDKYIDDWTIEDGAITPSIDIPTNYIRIVGSRLNDGVHSTANTDLVNEEFHGAIWIMSPPSDFLALVEEIKAWQEKYGSVDSTAMSPFQSESFGGYAYTKASGSNSASGSSIPTWKDVFASRLNKYRRIRVL